MKLRVQAMRTGRSSHQNVTSLTVTTAVSVIRKHWTAKVLLVSTAYYGCRLECSCSWKLRGQRSRTVAGALTSFSCGRCRATAFQMPPVPPSSGNLNTAFGPHLDRKEGTRVKTLETESPWSSFQRPNPANNRRAVCSTSAGNQA